jgi:hypothetical protein
LLPLINVHLCGQRTAINVFHLALHKLLKTLCLPRLTFSNPHIVFNASFPNAPRNKFPILAIASFPLYKSLNRLLLTFSFKKDAHFSKVHTG